MVTYAGVITLVFVIIMAKIDYGYLCCSDYIIFVIIMARIGYGYLCRSDYISFGNNYGQNRLWLPMLQ